jgi:hypothetical protein
LPLGASRARGGAARSLPRRRRPNPRARQAALGLELIRDGNGPRALETLVRYRGAVLAELFRALAALKALQADAREVPEHRTPAAPAILPPPRLDQTNPRALAKTTA